MARYDKREHWSWLSPRGTSESARTTSLVLASAVWIASLALVVVFTARDIDDTHRILVLWTTAVLVPLSVIVGAGSIVAVDTCISTLLGRHRSPFASLRPQPQQPLGASGDVLVGPCRSGATEFLHDRYQPFQFGQPYTTAAPTETTNTITTATTATATAAPTFTTKTVKEQQNSPVLTVSEHVVLVVNE